MNLSNVFKAALVGVALFAGSAPMTYAETLRVMDGGVSSKLNVPMNRAVVVESDVVFAELSIANPSIADISTLSDRTIYVLGKQPGRTTLTLLGPDGRLITNVEVRVTADVGELKERLREVLPGEPIEVRPANDGLVLSGTVSSTAAIDRALDLAQRYAPERVSNLMLVGGSQQVMLKVRFSEMNRSVRKSLSSSVALSTPGTDISTASGTGTYSSSGNYNSVFGLGDDADGSITLTDESEGVFQIGANIGSVQLNILLEALETKGFIRTLAEPNLTALSGQRASFLAGGEYPVPVSQDGSDVSVEFKEFGIKLEFTPRVVGKNINLALETEVSGIDSTISYSDNGLVINGFSTRSTSTTVELQDGESFAIAGLLSDDFTSSVGQVPWLGDLPIIGTLFRSAEYQRSQSELVILISAHLVTPTKGDTFALPTDRVQPPTEGELFLLGKDAKTRTPKKGAAGEVARQDFTGSYGYVME